MKLVVAYGETLPTIFPLLAVMSFSHFVSFNNHVVTERQLMEEDVTREALEAVQSAELMDHEDEQEDGEDSDTDITPTSL